MNERYKRMIGYYRSFLVQLRNKDKRRDKRQKLQIILEASVALFAELVTDFGIG